MILHPIPPVYDENSKILILGSFPSVKSREEAFFYGHPQNRFWRILAAVLESEPPVTVEEKRAFLLLHNVALWDVIASCDIVGSADSSITNVRANDIASVLKNSKIEKIFVNGKTAQKYYDIYIKDTVNREAIYLPSTSPANASWKLDKLIEAWRIIK